MAWKDISRYKYHFTYITRNLINGMYYKGRHSTNKLNDRYLGSSLVLKAAIKQFGYKSFKREIVTMYKTLEESIQGELEFITKEDVESPMCYNKSYGGLGSERFTDDMRKEASRRQFEYLKTHKHQRLGCKSSPEALQKNKDYHNRPDVKQHEREIKIGELNPMYGVRGFDHPTAKAVLCVDTGVVYGSAMQAAHEYKCNFQNISKVCKGERHTCAGMHWRFA